MAPGETLVEGQDAREILGRALADGMAAEDGLRVRFAAPDAFPQGHAWRCAAAWAGFGSVWIEGGKDGKAAIRLTGAAAKNLRRDARDRIARALAAKPPALWAARLLCVPALAALWGGAACGRTAEFLFGSIRELPVLLRIFVAAPFFVLVAPIPSAIAFLWSCPFGSCPPPEGGDGWRVPAPSRMERLDAWVGGAT